MKPLQRRRWERYRKELDVTIAAGDGATVRGRTQDVCDGGLGVICRDKLEVGADYGFTIAEIADTPLIGTVRWCTPVQNADKNLIGVQFTGLSENQSESISACIAHWKSESGVEDG